MNEAVDRYFIMWRDRAEKAEAHLAEAAAFLDGLADTFDSWSVFAGPAYDCREMAKRLRGET